MEKPTIGDDPRPIEADDILRANHLMYAASVVTLGCVAVAGFAIGALGKLGRGGKGGA